MNRCPPAVQCASTLVRKQSDTSGMHTSCDAYCFLEFSCVTSFFQSGMSRCVILVCHLISFVEIKRWERILLDYLWNVGNDA